MSDVPSLQVLADNRKDLLLAEVAALLHDVGKLSTQFIDQMSTNPTSHSQGFEHETAVVKISGFVDAEFVKVLESQQLRNLLHFPPIAKNEQIGQALDLILHHDKARHSAFLIRLLNRCDGSDSGADKGTTRQDGLPREAKQEYGHTFIATAFGEESKLEEANLDTARLDLSKYVGSALLLLPSSRADLLDQIRNRFSRGLAETRRSANDVTLWDHSFSVGTLYKTSLATFLLKGALDLAQVHWRLLRVNFDVLGLYAKAVKIADLMGYQKAVEDACTAVKKLVEEDYPLGNEIYRDSSGIYFTFPDLDLPTDLEQEIRRRVEAVELELAPRIAVEQPQGSTPIEQFRRMLAEGRRRALQDLAQPFDARNLSPRWQQEWETAGTGNWELCPVCRLRPMEEGQDACKTCLQRRQSRVQGWLADPQQTIWIDEVADINGRLALIVGQFGLDDWLSGDLVQTMLVRAVENDPDKCVSKNPSPARLRRIWETTRTFWQNALDERDPQGNPIIPLVSKRLEIIPQDHGRLNLEKFHTYELVVKGVRVSLVWDGNRFITCDNLDYLAKPEQLGDRLENIATERKKFTLEEPVGYGAKNKVLGDVTIAQVNSLDQRYTPAIPILAEPRTFMALVPANRALEVVKAIKAKYEREMGKVRNRLPLTLGVVYFGRRTPLAAALDAGRRMLKRERHKEDLWQVSNVTQGALLPNGWPQEVKLTLSLGEQAVEIAVPTVMGDGATEDLWYPYWCVQGEPNDRKRWFVGPNGEHWVHVSELRNGDQVLFTPSTFDFEFLDTAGRRFEVTYAESGRRRADDKPQRPYWLEQVDAIEHTWREMSRLSKSQIYQVRDLVEGKRAEWGKPRGAQALALPQDDVFRCFVGDVLREAGVYSEELERAALSGMLSDALELYLEIMKENPKKGGNHE